MNRCARPSCDTVSGGRPFWSNKLCQQFAIELHLDLAGLHFNDASAGKRRDNDSRAVGGKRESEQAVAVDESPGLSWPCSGPGDQRVVGTGKDLVIGERQELDAPDLAPMTIDPEDRFGRIRLRESGHCCGCGDQERDKGRLATSARRDPAGRPTQGRPALAVGSDSHVLSLTGSRPRCPNRPLLGRCGHASEAGCQTTVAMGRPIRSPIDVPDPVCDCSGRHSLPAMEDRTNPNGVSSSNADHWLKWPVLKMDVVGVPRHLRA